MVRSCRAGILSGVIWRMASGVGPPTPAAAADAAALALAEVSLGVVVLVAAAVFRDLEEASLKASMRDWRSSS